MKLTNRRAKRDYKIIDIFEAGIALIGFEVKSIKDGRGDLTSSFVRIRNSEAWLVGANIPQYGGTTNAEYDPLRTRKLLLHKEEIISLGTKTHQEHLTLVPISLYTRGRLVKAKIALAKGKREYEKREAKRRKDIERDVERELKNS